MIEETYLQWPSNAVMLHTWPNAIIAPPRNSMPQQCSHVACCRRDRMLSSPPRNPMTQQCSHVACVTECYHRPTQKPYMTLPSCCVHDRILSSPHPETLWPNNVVMLHVWPNAFIAPPRNPMIQQPMTQQCIHVACCMRDRMISSPYPETPKTSRKRAAFYAPPTNYLVTNLSKTRINTVHLHLH